MDEREAKVLRYMLWTGLGSFAAISIFVILNRENQAIVSFALVGIMQLFGGTMIGVTGGATTTPPLWALVLGSFIPGMITLLVAYPLFYLFYDEVSRFPLLAPFVRKLENTVESENAFIRRFEHLGIFIFCFIPVAMTGSVVSACIARVLGFRLRETLAIVVPAAFLAAIFWSLVARGVIGGAMLLTDGHLGITLLIALLFVAGVAVVVKKTDVTGYVSKRL